ncbi:thiamine pyrophosphate-dependent dehydrogenase E1 component subunit alpha [Streptomyces sp. NPDC057580]|uniref:thiamine pyrophosphate-dependent dehydrogenase E1 component subunit alpha n=1 Tax=Streptomyces sp. NPDC057580 TaxID=3346173 RepID=UPI00369139BE
MTLGTVDDGLESGPGTLSRQDLLALHRTMLRIRHFELAGAKQLATGKLSGTLHLSVGQEATATGVCSQLRADDYVTSTHRGHGHCLAKGADPRLMMAELFGASAGYCKGRSGSMHIADASSGLLGANGIVGGGIPMAVGAGLSASVRGTDQVAVCFFGEGAAGEGTLHESLNLAALWQLPVVFVCENNRYAELSPIADVLAAQRVADLAAPFGIPSRTDDGNDIVAVVEAIRWALSRARGGQGPVLLEFETYRQSGHFEGDAQTYRSKDERDHWLGRDPLLLSEQRLHDLEIEQDILGQIADEAAQEMLDAADWASDQPPAPALSMTEDVYHPEPEPGLTRERA